jgi:GNAT superfamily N-acetyltransferase
MTALGSTSKACGSALAQASSALTEALIEDPFYLAISDDFSADLKARERALNLYFQYSLEEAERTGRLVIAPDPAVGASAWLLPRSPEIDAAESSAKSAYLASVLGPTGFANYSRIVGFMAPLAANLVPAGAWYLSIVGVLPSAQGQGLGASLLASTLAEASQARVPCYLETFSPRNLRFYERFGFRRVASYREPTTHADYAVMLRNS